MIVKMSKADVKVDVRVASDKASKAKSEYGELFNVIPVDMYGKVVTCSKNTDLQEIIDDANRFYGLD